MKRLTLVGFQERYKQEYLKEKSCPWSDRSDSEMLEYLTEYYNKMVDYYQDAATNKRAMLLYLA